MNRLYELVGLLAILAVPGVVIGLADRRRFDPRWLAVALVLVAADDALLTRGYGLIPRLPGYWNWTGKLLALAATLAIAARPALGWARVGLTLRQRPGSARVCLPVAIAYLAWFVALALAFPRDPATGETIAFQLTMPGFEEEPFYRGTLLLALDRTYTGRVRWLGVDWGWGALLSSLLFGAAHALSYGAGGYVVDPLPLALTGVPALLAVWLRYRSGSLALPIALHNFGNTIGFLI